MKITRCVIFGIMFLVGACNQNFNDPDEVRQSEKLPTYIELQGKAVFDDGTVLQSDQLQRFLLPVRYWGSPYASAPEYLGGPRNPGLTVEVPYDVFILLASGNITLSSGSLATFSLEDGGSFTVNYTDYRIEPYLTVNSFDGGPSWKQSSRIQDECGAWSSSQNSPTTTKIAQIGVTVYAGNFSAWNGDGWFAHSCDGQADFSRVTIDLRGSAPLSEVTFGSIYLHWQGF